MLVDLTLVFKRPDLTLFLYIFLTLVLYCISETEMDFCGYYEMHQKKIFYVRF